MLTIETLLIIVFVTASALFPYQTNYHCYMDIINVLILRLNLGTEMVSCHMLPMMASLHIFAISTVCRW